MNTLIVIPCYNHGSLCNELISEINNKDILIVDDGSDIPFIPEQSNNNITLLKNDINKGKGYSIKEGAKHAIKSGYNRIIVIDADMQHDSTKIDDFINIDFKYDFVYGKRNFNKNMPLLRIISNILTSTIISLLCNKSIKDSQCGYRLYNTNLFNNLDSLENGYHFESEILLKKINSKSNITYINIPTIYNGSDSHIRNFHDTYKFIKLILRNLL